MKLSNLCTLLLAGTTLWSCAPVPLQKGTTSKCRVTYYAGAEKIKRKHHRGWFTWGRRTASGTPAKQGVTCAAGYQFPIGTKVKIPALKPVIGSDTFTVLDRGSADHWLRNRVDVFVSSLMVMNKLKTIMPEYLEVETKQ